MGDQALRRVWIAALVVGLQSVAAVYFIYDAVQESSLETLPLVDIVVGLALLAGSLFGGLLVRRLLAEARRQAEALRLARGAIGEVMLQRFADWSLSRGESEVALYALKGCSIAEIAGFRGSAEGTVRSQLSQIYTKAGVSGQAMLMSLFLDELIDAQASGDTA